MVGTVGWVVLSGNITSSPSYKLELASFSAKLRIQDGAECGNIVELDLSYNFCSKWLGGMVGGSRRNKANISI